MATTFLSATLWALMEIEVEGPHGWAANTETCPSGIFNWTMYHLYMNLLVVFCHLHIYGLSPEVLFYTTVWFLQQDWLWFVFNPHYTRALYAKSKIWWHAGQPWWGGAPLHFWAGAGIIFASGLFVESSPQDYFVWCCSLSAAAWIAPTYHRFHAQMHGSSK